SEQAPGQLVRSAQRTPRPERGFRRYTFSRPGLPARGGEIKMARAALLAAGAIALSGTAWAHHGFGRIDGSQNVTLEGTLTGVDFCNPHAYLYFDAVDADGKTLKMRCEMRAATVLR